MANSMNCHKDSEYYIDLNSSKSPSAWPIFRDLVAGTGGIDSISSNPISVWPNRCIRFVGTGGACASENVSQFSDWIAMLGCTMAGIELKRSCQVLPVDTRSVRDHLLNVRETFRLNMTELAQIFGVTRPAVYSWLEDVEPKSEARTLILKFSRIADQLAKACIERPELYIRRPMFNGQSIVDLLKAGKSIGGEVDAIAALARKEAAARAEASTRYEGRVIKQQLDSPDTLATPLMSDRD